MKLSNTSPQLVASTITVLTALHKNTVKTYFISSENQLQCDNYGSEWEFDCKLVPVNGIGKLASLLTAGSKQKNVIVIRGTPALGLRGPSARNKENFPEAAVGCNWVMLDFDNQSVPEGMNPNGIEAIEFIIKKLPVEFHDVSYFYQFSSSAGILKTDGTPLKSGLNVHLFFWFKCPIQGKLLSAYFEAHCYKTGFFDKALDRNEQPVIKTGVDLSVIRSSVQPHYIGLPIIKTGVISKLPAEDRQGLVNKKLHEVVLPEMSASLIPDTLSKRSRVGRAWKEECGFVPARITTRAKHGGISVSTYHRRPDGPSPATNRELIEAKPYGENQDTIILHFKDEFSPGSYYVKQASPQLAVKFGDYTTIPLKELSEGAYAYVRDELEWFSEIKHVDLQLNDDGYMRSIATFNVAKNALLLAPTGAGKTTAFCEYAKTNSKVMIYAAQTIALVDQMMADLTKDGVYKFRSKSFHQNVPRAVRYSGFTKDTQLQQGVVYVTTNESLHKFISAAARQGVEYELILDEVHVALDDFMRSEKKNKLLEHAIGRASRCIFMTGTVTFLQITKLMDTISRACGALSPATYACYQFQPVRNNPLFIADKSNFGADFVALLRRYAQLKKEGGVIPRTVIITSSTRMRVFDLLLEHFGLAEDSCVVSRQESLQEDIEVARISRLPILVSSPLFAIGLTFDAEPLVFWTYFSYLQVDESQIIQTLNRANRGREQCEVRLYIGETNPRPITIPDAVLERIKMEEFLKDEASVQGLLDGHFHVDRVTYLSIRDAEKNTAKALHRLLEDNAIQNYTVQYEWEDTLGSTKEDHQLYSQFRRAARESYLDDVAEQANGKYSQETSELLYQLDKLYQKSKAFGDAAVQVQREIEDEERGICMVLCGVSAKESAYIKPARIRRLFGDLDPYLTSQYSYEKTGEWRAAAAEKTLAMIPLLEAMQRMVDGQLTGHDFANLMRRPGLRGAVKALADNEANYISWQKKLARLDEISDCIRTKASDAQKDELKEERFGIARDFLKTIGVVFEDGEESGQDRINSRDPIAPDWDYDEMIATLSRRAESLKRLPETPVVFGIVERDWAGPDVSRELCETCVHCERDYFCALGIPIQPIWDDLEAATSDCETYRKLPARLLA